MNTSYTNNDTISDHVKYLNANYKYDRKCKLKDYKDIELLP